MSNDNVSVLSTEENETEPVLTVETMDVLSSEVVDNEDVPVESAVDVSQTSSILDTLHTEIFDDPLIYPTATDPSIIRFFNTATNNGQRLALNSATVTALIVELTSPKSIDYQFLLDFFLTYRMFLKTNTLAEILLTRFLWAFKLTVHSNQDDVSKTETGKLVLIRTFVTIRHWLLNYFQDDFINNNDLKIQFVAFINELSEVASTAIASGSLKEKANMEIGTRILIEMKKVYINLCSIYWSTIPLEHIQPSELLNYPLNAYEHMNNSRLSVMGLQQAYDPSFRRSGILSLYNNKSNSATNLLLQTHNEHKSKTLANFLYHNNKPTAKPFQIFNENDRHFLHPKDSLVSLNKSYITKVNPKTPLKPSITNIIKEEVKYTPLDGVKRLSKNELDDEKYDLGIRGFTTNGDIRVFTDSKISKIIPTTPNKKLRVDSDQQAAAAAAASPPGNATNPVLSKPKKVSFQTPKRNNDSKGGFSKLAQSWKKHFQRHKMDHKEFSPLIDNVSNIINPAKNSNMLHKNNSQSTLTDKPEDDFPLPNLNVRVDFLSARIIEEFQFLLNDQGFKSNLSKQLMNEPRRRQSVFSLATIFKGEDDDSMDNEHTFNASPIKNANRHTPIMLQSFQDDAISFKAPSVSFNWTDSFNDASNSENNVGAVDDVVPSMINEIEINDNDEGIVEDTGIIEGSKFFNGNVSVKYQDEFDFNPTSQQQRISLYSTKSYISYDSALSRDDIMSHGHELNTDAFSVRRLSDANMDDNASYKSYLSYDSALSIQANGENLNDFKINETKLKKKLPFQDLKISSPTIPQYEQSVHLDVPLEKDEYDNIMLLRDLPYSLSDISSSRTNIVMRDSSSLFDLVKEYRLSLKSHLETETGTKAGLSANNRSIHSIDDDDDEDSIADYESTLSKIEYLRGDDDNEDGAFESEIGSRVSMIPSIHSSIIMPFPGLDSAAIAELAAIPDDTFSDDPIAAALMKLEGKYIKAEREELGQVYYGLNDELSQDEQMSAQSSIDELKLQEKVRDLFITDIPGSPTALRTQLDDKASVSTINSQREICASTPYKDGQELVDGQPLTDNSPRDDNLTLQSIMDSSTHISFILSYDSEHLAQQLTVIEKDALLEIDWRELIELRWQQKVEPINSWLQLLLYENKRKGINLVISRFNLAINWIVSEILLTSNINERKAVITRFIHVADHCKRLQNYSTLMQIVLALTSAKISNLKKTWSLIDKKDIAVLSALEKLASPFKNFANLRNDSRVIVPSKGCIPFLGLYLSDLTFNAERPNFFKKNNPNDTATSIDRSIIDDYTESSKLINFSKFKTSANVVRSLIQCIEWSKLYTIKVDNEIVSKCLYIKSLTDEEMNICIQRIGE